MGHSIATYVAGQHALSTSLGLPPTSRILLLTSPSVCRLLHLECGSVSSQVDVTPPDHADKLYCLVTGSSSGFGKAMAELALNRGDNVVATLRRPEMLEGLQALHRPDRLLIVKVDVTKLEDITNAFMKAEEKFGRVDVVFNNAGYGLLSEVEGTSDEIARAIFETNFWGAANVMREAVRFFRNNNERGGRLINISSFAGVAALPCLGYYSASRHGKST